jgi:hypothetical protein
VEEIKNLAAEFGIERLGFLTLTFRDHVTEIKEAQRRFHSLNTHILKTRYRRAIGVWERQKSQRLHFHLIVVLDAGIRTGFDFEAIARRDYRSASESLRKEWAFWRVTAPKYGFGRTELLPVKSTAEGIARYVGSYIKKHIGNRELADKGARGIRFIGFKPGDRKMSTNFSWVTDKSWLWRQKLPIFASRLGCRSLRHLTTLLGRRWAFIHQEAIMSIELPEGTCYPSEECAERETMRKVLQEARCEHHRISLLKSRQEADERKVNLGTKKPPATGSFFVPVEYQLRSFCYSPSLLNLPSQPLDGVAPGGICLTEDNS